MDTRADLARMIADARNIVVFTGAGISTESGIPDFRSPGGVWSKMSPIPFQDFVRSETHRRESWARAFGNRAGWTGAEPNEGHLGVARLVHQGKAKAVITQNVDGLHLRSGVPAEQIIELHGNATYAACLSCDERYELPALKAAFLERDEIPMCLACGGIVKTATISFGQSMPEVPMRRAELATRSCDLFLVLGSSLVVYPAAAFPKRAKLNGALVAIVNREPTDHDAYADLVLHDEIGPVMREVTAAN